MLMSTPRRPNGGKDRERRAAASASADVSLFQSVPADAEMLAVLQRLYDEGPINRAGVPDRDTGIGKDAIPYALATELMARNWIMMSTIATRGMARNAVPVWEITPAGIDALTRQTR
jgi:hypothetical protein